MAIINQVFSPEREEMKSLKDRRVLYMYSGGFIAPFYGFASSPYLDKRSFRCEFILMTPI